MMNPIIRAFVVRRTRQGIQKEYGVLNIKGKKAYFPKVEPYVHKHSYKKETSAKIVQKIEKNPYFDAREIHRVTVDTIVNHTKILVHPIDNLGEMEKEIKPEEVVKKSPIYLTYQAILF